MGTIDRSLQARKASIKMLKYYLHRAQHRMRQQADKGRSDRQFEVNDWVILSYNPIVNQLWRIESV